jgi:hypothetical protein
MPAKRNTKAAFLPPCPLHAASLALSFFPTHIHIISALVNQRSQRVSASIDAAAGAPDISRPAHEKEKLKTAGHFLRALCRRRELFVSKRAPRYIANTFSRRKNFNELACGTRTGSARATSSPLENVRSQRYFQITPRARPGKLLIFAS